MEKHLEMGLLDHTVGSSSDPVLSLCAVSHTVAAPVLVTPSGAGGFPASHILTDSFLIFWVVAILTGRRWHLVMVLMLVSLMTRDGHLLVYLLAIRLCPVSFFCSWPPFSRPRYRRDCLFPVVCSWLLCHKLIGRTTMGLLLGSLFCCVDLRVCFYAGTNSVLLSAAL